MLALGYSAYRTYIVRSQVSEGIALANELIPGVTEFFHRHGDVPAKLEGPLHSDLKARSPFVDSVTVIDGRIDVLYGKLADPSIAGRLVSLTPYETVNRHVVWICGNEMPGPGLEPLGYSGGSRQAVRKPSTIEARYLSNSCR